MALIYIGTLQDIRNFQKASSSYRSVVPFVSNTHWLSISLWGLPCAQPPAVLSCSYPELHAVTQTLAFFCSRCCFLLECSLLLIKKILFTLYSLVQTLLHCKTQGRIKHKINTSVEYLHSVRQRKLQQQKRESFLPSWSLYSTFLQHLAPGSRRLMCSYL